MTPEKMTYLKNAIKQSLTEPVYDKGGYSVTFPHNFLVEMLEEIKSLETSLGEKTKEANNLKLAYHAYIEREAQAQKKISETLCIDESSYNYTTIDNIKKLVGKLGEATSKIINFEFEKRGLQQEITHLQLKNGDLEILLVEKDEKIKNLNIFLSIERNNYNNTKNYFDKYAKDVDKIKIRLSELLNSDNTSVPAIEESIENLIDELDMAKSKISDLKKSKKDLQRMAIHREGEVKFLKERLESVQSELSKLRNVTDA